MSNNLDLEQVAENQASPEVTVNDAFGGVDAAITESLTVSLTSGNAVITASQYRSAIRFLCSGVSTGGRTVTLPAVKRLVFIESAAANTDDISIIVGSTTLTLRPGDRALAYTDGTTDGLQLNMMHNAAPPFDLHVFSPGLIIGEKLIYRLKATRPFTLPEDLVGSYATARVASTGTKVFTIEKNGTEIGTFTFTTSDTGTLAFAAEVSFAVGDVLTITEPDTTDATLEDVSFDLKGIF